MVVVLKVSLIRLRCGLVLLCLIANRIYKGKSSGVVAFG